MRKPIAVMGSFVADLTFRTRKIPSVGETVLGTDFRIGPGGKGSNQAVGIARLGATVGFICKLGHDTFGELARETYREEDIITEYCFDTFTEGTGAAAIIVDDLHGTNSIVVVPGSGLHLTIQDVDLSQPLITNAGIFLTQLEVPVATVEYALSVARGAGVPTVLNPAPAIALPEHIYGLCDYLTPNEIEASMLTGVPVKDISEADIAAGILLARGARNVIITLGANGAYAKNAVTSGHVPAVDAGPVVETTGAGDAFNAGLAIGITEGRDILSATRFACAVAGISVTRHGTSLAMPFRAEVDELLKRP